MPLKHRERQESIGNIFWRQLTDPANQQGALHGDSGTTWMVMVRHQRCTVALATGVAKFKLKGLPKVEARQLESVAWYYCA